MEQQNTKYANEVAKKLNEEYRKEKTSIENHIWLAISAI